MVSEVQEFTVTGNERERRFIEVIVKNARENKSRVKKKKKKGERKREREVNQAAERRRTRYSGASVGNLQAISFEANFHFYRGTNMADLMKYQVLSRRK